MTQRPSRAEREKTARALIRQHKDWGRRRINNALREKYGVGLSHEYVLELKREIHKPTRQDIRKRALLKDGFLPFEAEAYKTESINTISMRAFRADRRSFIRQLKKEGIPKSGYRSQILQDYIEKDYLTPKGKPTPYRKYYDFAYTRKPERPILPSADTKMPPKGRFLTEVEILLKAGFHPRLEIPEYTKAVAKDGTPQVLNLNSETWKATINRRIEWMKQLHKAGLTYNQIMRRIERMYQQDPKLSPWDFVRKEYEPAKKTKDFQSAYERREESKRKTKDFYDIPRKRKKK